MLTAFCHQFITSFATQGIPVARAKIMRAFIVFSCLALAAAKPQYSYSQPSSLLGSSSDSHGHAIGGPALLPSSSNQNLGLAPPVAAPLQSFQPAPITTTTVQKHIYVHVPPQEQEEPIFAPAPIVNHQKHYKIIFIKAPSAPSISQQLLQSQQTQSISEEKTLVYVLVKKPDSVADIRIPQPAAPAPSKPEVYFIKYKAEKEHGAPLQLSAPAPSSSAPVLLSPPAPSSSFSGPSPASIALPSSASSSGSDIPLLNLGSSQASSVIQPRHPSPVYGPAN